ncbi:MAG: urea ABC transporter ATP-binding subunit UrtE [Pseudanabaenaceae cyanobacterium SKYGB_i_bin29]|nr:urea ABC transporter ATP-binding subunit UrtE [Pseudanabaenaceae cyanobacterium SKYG29]MDW8421813.1 urea ABC transporter ATP-binding subunit UrtE [Pseudanabaenaceae cyanobacterium SKYGB_i_bin29]
MLTISNLDVFYGESHILRQVDLHVNPGQIVCLIGRNGVGKTTLLKTIMGLLSPRAGDIKFQDRSILSLKPYARAQLGIGYVPQGREILPRLTVRENLLLGLEAQKNGKVDVEEALAEVFQLFPVLASMQNRRGGDLSGGQQQQLAIGRALLGNPQLLLMDEPTEGIQPSIILEIEAAVRSIVSKRGIGILLVEQHLHFVKQADYYYAMQKGGIVASGSTDSLSREIIQSYLSV